MFRNHVTRVVRAAISLLMLTSIIGVLVTMYAIQRLNGPDGAKLKPTMTEGRHKGPLSSALTLPARD